MNSAQLFEQIKKKRSFLCIGLDTDIQKLPKHLLDTSDPIFAFNKEIIDSTHDLAVAYKPNLAFYESLGAEGLISLDKTVKYPGDNTSIGILLCKSKSKITVEYALELVNHPMGVATYTYSQLPKEIAQNLPNEQDFKDILLQNFEE